MGRTITYPLRAVSGVAIATALAFAAAPALQAQSAASPAAATPVGEVRGIPAWDIASNEIPADPDVTFGRLPNGDYDPAQVGVNNAGALAGAQGVGLRYEIVVGSLPDGISLDATTGSLSGTATVKRLDFGVGGGDWADTSVIPNEIKVTTKVVFVAK